MANPTIEQFESNPRSAVIRRTCLELVGEIEQLSNDDPSDVTQAHLANIESYRSALVEMGIVLNMYAGKARLAPDAYSDPVVMAEYVAGQILSATANGQYPHYVVNVAYGFLNDESSSDDDGY